jgi:transcriptional regulator with XRE-family HTH domain
MPKLKHRISELRLKRGITQERLAKMIGTSAPQVTRLENYQRKLSLEWLLLICKALRVTADEVVDLPYKGGKSADCDKELLGSIMGWILDACKQYGIKPECMELGKWAGYVYGDTLEKGLTPHETRRLTFKIVRLGQVEPKRSKRRLV